MADEGTSRHEPIVRGAAARPPNGLRRVLAEPLVHFLAAGGMLFGLHAWVAPAASAPAGDPRPELRIGLADVTWIAGAWARQRGRPPTEDELRGLVTEFVREELLAREARALGLDRNDTVVRRRLAQKMQFLEEDGIAAQEPAEDELRALHARHPELFGRPGTISFSQVYFREGATARDAEAAARSALELLTDPARETDLTRLGDPTMLPGACERQDRLSVGAQFGDAFADAVFDAPVGSWHGPVRSPFGLHLVRVTERTPGAQRPFEEARPDVLVRWRDARRAEIARERFAELLGRTRIVADEAVLPFLPEAARQAEEP